MFLISSLRKLFERLKSVLSNPTVLVVLGCLPSIASFVILPLVLQINQSYGFWISLLGYLPAAIIGAKLSSAEFVSSRHKTIKQVLKEGRCYHIGGSSLILACLTPYIVFFGMADGQWNEVFAAVAAYLVTFMHMLDTAITLRKAEHFQRFAYRCFDMMRFFKYEGFERVPEAKIEEEISQRLFINEDMLNNELTGGDLNVWYYLVGSWTCRDSCEAYVRWATLFLATYGETWLREFALAFDNHDLALDKWFVSQQGFTNDCWGSRRMLSSKFPPSLTKKFCDENGIFSKNMVLREALSQGFVLPYEYGYAGIESNAQITLEPYGSGIRKMIDGLPVESQAEWIKISPQSLEWFLVCLHLHHKAQEQSVSTEEGHELGFEMMPV